MNSTNHNQGSTEQEAAVTVSKRTSFLLDNFKHIVELEKNLRFVLSETEIKRNPYLVLKLCEGGWLPFREVFKLQKIFEDEQSFFKALSFVKRVEICEIVKDSEGDQDKDQNSSEALLIKLNENFGKPLITFNIRHNSAVERGKCIEVVDNEERIRELILRSIFWDHIKDFEIQPAFKENSANQGKPDKENAGTKAVKIESDLSAAISGLKCFLQEFA